MLEDATFWALVGLILFFALIVYMKVPAKVAGGARQARRHDPDRARPGAKAPRGGAGAARRVPAQGARGRGRGRGDHRPGQARGRRASASRPSGGSRTTSRAAPRWPRQKIAQAEAQALQEVRSLSADVAIAAVAAHPRRPRPRRHGRSADQARHRRRQGEAALTREGARPAPGRSRAVAGAAPP